MHRHRSFSWEPKDNTQDPDRSKTKPYVPNQDQDKPPTSTTHVSPTPPPSLTPGLMDPPPPPNADATPERATTITRAAPSTTQERFPSQTRTQRHAHSPLTDDHAQARLPSGRRSLGDLSPMQRRPAPAPTPRARTHSPLHRAGPLPQRPRTKSPAAASSDSEEPRARIPTQRQSPLRGTGSNLPRRASPRRSGEQGALALTSTVLGQDPSGCQPGGQPSTGPAPSPSPRRSRFGENLPESPSSFRTALEQGHLVHLPAQLSSSSSSAPKPRPRSSLNDTASQITVDSFRRGSVVACTEEDVFGPRESARSLLGYDENGEMKKKKRGLKERLGAWVWLIFGIFLVLWGLFWTAVGWSFGTGAKQGR